MEFYDAKALQTGCIDDIESQHPMINELYLIVGNKELSELIHVTYEEFVQFYEKLEKDRNNYMIKRRGPGPKETRMDLFYVTGSYKDWH